MRFEDWKKSQLVFSSGPDAQEPTAPKPSEIQEARAPEKQRVRVALDRKGRKGKSVTVITGLEGSEAKLDKLLKEFKNKCGSGGALKSEQLELQGDHRERVLQLLQERGYRPKLTGG